MSDVRDIKSAKSYIERRMKDDRSKANRNILKDMDKEPRKEVKLPPKVEFQILVPLDYFLDFNPNKVFSEKNPIDGDRWTLRMRSSQDAATMMDDLMWICDYKIEVKGKSIYILKPGMNLPII